MRLAPLLLPLVAVLACQCNASVTTDARPASGPSGAPSSPPPPPPPATATPIPWTRPTNKADCDKCNGLWAVHGIEQVEKCVCKTKDAGKACRDGAECEGSCIVGEDAKFEVVEPGPPPRGFYTGRCADYDTTFGCHRSLVKGARAKPLPAEEAAHRFCVD